MNDDIDALQSPENGKTSKVDRAATAIRLVLEAPEYGWAASTSVPTLPTAESMPASAPQTFLADIPSRAALAFGDRTVIAAEAKTPVDRPGAVRRPAGETSTNADGAAARAIQVYPEHPYAEIIPPIVGGSQLCDEGEAQIDFSVIKCTAEALAAIADLDDEPRIEKMMRVGAAIDRGKVELPHGSLTHWYKDVLRKSESWCSQHWRLYRDRYILQHALDWAGRTKHKLAGSYAIEQLLKIIADYKLTILGASARPPRKPSAPKPLASQAPPPDSIEKLLSLMSDAERELELVRLDDVADARGALSSLIQRVERVERRLRDLVETCSLMQV